MSLHYPHNPKCPRQAETDEMKRSIHDTQITSPEPSMLSTSTSMSATIQRAQPKSINESRLSTNEYWREKASNLQNPFAAGDNTEIQSQQQTDTMPELGNEGPKELPKPRPLALDLTTGRADIPAIQLQTPPPDARVTRANNDKTIINPPLSGNAISNILQHTKAECPKAQAWITAQRISEETKLRLTQRIGRLDVDERRSLERRVAARLAERAGQMQGRKENQEQGKDWEERNLTPRQRVRKADIRLQRVLGLE